jgi:hypothetical protein
MVIYTIFSWLSLLKQKLYCNVEKIIYTKEDKNIPIIHPKIEIEYKIISNIDELKKHYKNKNIKKKIVKFKKFLNNSCKMYLVLHKNHLIGYYYICKLSDFKPYLYLNYSLFEGNNKYYIFFCHTFDEYQGNGIYTYILSQMCKSTLSNYGKVYISTNASNIASQKGIETVDFKKLGILKYKKIGGVTFVSKFLKG